MQESLRTPLTSGDHWTLFEYGTRAIQRYDELDDIGGLIQLHRLPLKGNTSPLGFLDRRAVAIPRHVDKRVHEYLRVLGCYRYVY